MSDEQTIRDALDWPDGATDDLNDALKAARSALDRLVAERDAGIVGMNIQLLARAEAAEKERDAERRARKAVEEVKADEVLRERTNLEAQIASALARAEAAEKQRDEALDYVVLYVNERDEAVRLYGMEANAVVLYVNERDEAVRLYGMEANERRSAEARANNLAPYVKRSQAAESRCATLEAALREIAEDMEGVLRGQAVNDAPYAASVIPQRVVLRARAALAAATPPAEEDC